MNSNLEMFFRKNVFQWNLSCDNFYNSIEIGLSWLKFFPDFRNFDSANCKNKAGWVFGSLLESSQQKETKKPRNFKFHATHYTVICHILIFLTFFESKKWLALFNPQDWIICGEVAGQILAPGVWRQRHLTASIRPGIPTGNDDDAFYLLSIAAGARESLTPSSSGHSSGCRISCAPHWVINGFNGLLSHGLLFELIMSIRSAETRALNAIWHHQSCLMQHAKIWDSFCAHRRYEEFDNEVATILSAAPSLFEGHDAKDLRACTQLLCMPPSFHIHEFQILSWGLQKVCV